MQTGDERMKILVVDDERMICEWLEYCIQNNPGCELAGCAHNGEQALALFKQTDVDVVFTDIKMPVMGGLELLKKIKEHKPYVHCTLENTVPENAVATREFMERTYASV